MPIIIPVDIDSDSFEAGLSKLEDMAQDAGKSIGDDLGKGAKKAEKAMSDTGQAAEDLGDVVGLPVDKIKKLASGFGALSAPAAVVIGSIGAVAVGAGLMTAAIVGSVTAAKDLVKYLKPLAGIEGFGFSKAQVAQIQKANDSLQAIGVIVKQVVARLGAEFAPAVEKVSFLLVKFGLIALDTFNSFADGHDILRELARFMVGGLIDAMVPVISGLVNISQAMADLARAAGQDGLAKQLDKVKDRWTDFKDAIADKAVDGLIGGINRLDAATGDYDGRARKLIGSMKSLEGATKAVKDTFAQSVKIMDEDNALTEKAAGLIDNLTSSARKSVVDRLNGEAQVKAALEDQLALLEQVYQQAIQSATSDAQRAEATAKYEEARTQAVITAEEKIRAEQQKTADEAAKLAQDAAKNAQDATVGTISGLQGGLEGIATLIGGPVAGAIAGLILNLEGTVANIIDQLKSLPGIIKAIPSLLTSLVETLLVEVVPALLLAIPDLVEGLLKAIPTIITSIVKSIPLIITALLFAIPDIIQALILSLPDIILSLLTLMPMLIAGLQAGFIDALQAAWDWLLNDGLKNLGKALVQVFKDAIQSLRDLIGDLFGGSSKQNNDAPGMQRMGPQGGRVSLGAGDYYLAGRDPQALLAQALNGLAGGGGGAPAPAYAGGGQVNLAHQHRAFDGFFVRHAQLGGQTSQFFKSFSGSTDARGLR